MKSPLADNRPRTTALDPAQSFIVQAPAGSGKTGLLVRRFLVLLTLVEMPEEILAITFTRKASAEMKERIMEALAAVADKSHQAQENDELAGLAQAAMLRNNDLGWNLLENPQRLRVQTIDALCIDLVRNMPWSSRYGAVPKILVDNSVAEAYQDAARRTLNHIDSDGPGAGYCQTVLELLNARFDRSRELIAHMLGKRDLWLRGIPLSQRTQFESMWQRVVEQSIDQARNLIPVQLQHSLLPLLRYAADNLADKTPGHPISELREMQEFPTSDPAMLDQWRAIAQLFLTKRDGDYQFRKTVNKNQGFPADNNQQKEQKQALLKLLAQLREHAGIEDALSIIPLLPNCRFTDQQWRAMEALLKILRIAAAELKLVFSRGNSADFVEITQRAELALGGDESPTDLALSMDYRISHLLMDEVQDTSRAQLELITRLTRGWEHGDGRTMFFVGDPMQSIYRFREAEVANFLSIQQQGVGNIMPQSLVLESNFRSSSFLVNWFNDVFGEIFPSRDDIGNGAISYSPGTATSSDTTNTGVVVGAWIDDENDSEAVEISSQVTRLLLATPDLTIGILGRGRRHLVAIAQELRRRAIPFQAIDLESMQHRPAIQDLMALTRAILQPGDRTAWLSILRAPWCGIDIKDLATLAESNREATIIELACDPDVTVNLSKSGQQRLNRLVSQIEQPLKHSGRETLKKCLQAAWLNLGGPGCLDGDDIDNCESYFLLIDSLEQEFEQITPAILSSAVSKLWSTDSTPAQVQLLTIHKSKGLEFDVVFLPSLGRRTGNPEQELLRWARLGDLLLVAALPHGDDDADIFNSYLRKLERLRQSQEDRRLLYVACTRAQQRLYLYANLRTNSKGEIAAPVSGSLLSLLWPVLGPEFLDNSSGNQIREATRETSGTEQDSNLRRVPLGWAVPELPASTIHTPNIVTSTEPERDSIEFSWAGETLRITGIAIHKMLQDIEAENWSQWKKIDRLLLLRSYQSILVENGLTGTPLKLAMENILLAMDNVRADPRAEWIFSEQHINIQTEWPLTGMIDGHAVSIIIDRCFMDKNGVRWIIDFKSSRHEQQDIGTFLEQEQRRYARQMARYAEIAQLIEPRETQLALYFPLLSEWIEWHG